MAAGSSNSTAGILTQLCETPNSSSDDDSMSVLFPLPQAQACRYLGAGQKQRAPETLAGRR